MKIVVDLLGADSPQEVLAQGALQAVAENKNIAVVLVGNESKLNKIVKDSNVDKKRVEIADAKDFISNNEAPTALLRGREEASLSVCYKILKEDHDAKALISAGNTGALLVGAIYKAGLIQNVHRPSLATALPTAKGGLCCLVDCGANVEVKSSSLVEFAMLGSAFCTALLNQKNPTVGLLSVGKEDKKGTTVTREAFTILKESSLNFVGNVEGYDIMSGETDVIVCDGFAGNIVLKLSEYIGKLAVSQTEKALKDAGIKGVEEVCHKVWRGYDFNSQGGGILLGVNKVIMKAHGAANAETICCCVNQAATLAENGLPQKTAEIFANLNSVGD